MRRKTRLFMIGAFAVAAIAFAVIAASGINQNLVYYWTPSDLRANGEKAYGATIRLGGMVAPGSIRNAGGS
ncbi:MAG: cytochrome c maturation protein CcmE domain-containing protein, partial [Thermoanaerobaculia bacterium]